LPLNYNKPDGDKVDVFAAVLKARSSKGTNDPFVVLAGGPGQAASEVLGIVDATFRRLRNTRDVVIIDQRGTGLSHPIQCDIQDDIETLEEYSASVLACKNAQTLDVREFHFENVIRDMEEIRKSLGYEKLNLWGVSWGTRTAAQYLRRYPDNVRSIVVDGVLPPQVSLPLTVAQSSDRAKNKLFELCDNDTACKKRFPDLEGQFNSLLAKAKAGEINHEGINPITGEAVDFKLTFESIAGSFHGMLYNADAATLVPLVVDAAAKGDFNPWLTNNYNASVVGGGIYIGSFLSIICGDEISRTTPEAVKAAGAGTFGEDAQYRSWKAACDVWDYEQAEADTHDVLNSDIPTLILSGNLDPITPPKMGEIWEKSFSNSRHIIVEGAGHNTSFTSCMPRLITEFVLSLDVEALDATCLDNQKSLPIFTTINGSVN
jgi:pimeloyl-ACP methyl ester carboxylesterase